MNCIFNDLSFPEFVDTAQNLKLALKELREFHTTGRNYGCETYIHRDGLYASIVLGQEFRQAINQHLKKEERNRIFSLLDKSTPALPDDTAIPNGCLFFYEGKKVPCTGLAECAFRLHLGDASLAYSLTCRTYTGTTLPVSLDAGLEIVAVDVPNATNIDKFKHILDGIEPEPSCWRELLERVERLSCVHIEASARKSLDREPFERSLGRAVWERLQIIEKMATSSGGTYTELVRNYCHGDNAIFSEESETRINDLGDKLSFVVNGEKKICSFHGKIRHRKFRIHMDKRPAPGESVYIVHIGLKIL